MKYDCENRLRALSSCVVARLLRRPSALLRDGERRPVVKPMMIYHERWANEIRGELRGDCYIDDILRAHS